MHYGKRPAPPAASQAAPRKPSHDFQKKDGKAPLVCTSLHRFYKELSYPLCPRCGNKV